MATQVASWSNTTSTNPATINLVSPTPNIGDLVVVFVAYDYSTSPGAVAGWTQGTVFTSTTTARRAGCLYWRWWDHTASTAFSASTAAQVTACVVLAASFSGASNQVDQQTARANTASQTQSTATVTPTASVERIAIGGSFIRINGTWSTETIGGVAAAEVGDALAGTTASASLYWRDVASTTSTYAASALSSGASNVGGAALVMLKPGTTTVKTVSSNKAALQVVNNVATASGNNVALKAINAVLTITPDTAALKQANITKTVSTDTAAIQKINITKAVSGNTIALLATVIVSASSNTTSLAVPAGGTNITQTVSGSTATLKKVNIVLTATPNTTAAKQTGIVKTATSTAALKSINLAKLALTNTTSLKSINLIRTISGNTGAVRKNAITANTSSKAALRSVTAKSLSATVGLLGSSQHSAGSSVALKALNQAATASTNTTSLLGAGTSFVSALNNSAAIKQLACVRSVGPNDVGLKSTSIRSVGAAVALRSSIQKVAASSAALKTLGAIRQAPVLVALRHTALLNCPSNAAIKSINTRIAASYGALLAVGLERLVGSSAALQTSDNAVQAAGVSVAVSLFDIHTVFLSISGNTAFVVPDTSVIQTSVGVFAPIDIEFTITPFDPVGRRILVESPIGILFRVESA